MPLYVWVIKEVNISFDTIILLTFLHVPLSHTLHKLKNPQLFLKNLNSIHVQTKNLLVVLKL